MYKHVYLLTRVVFLWDCLFIEADKSNYLFIHLFRLVYVLLIKLFTVCMNWSFD